MPKKLLAEGIDSLIGGGQGTYRKPGRPQTATRVPTKTTQEGLKENEDRATFIVNLDLLDKVKAIAYWNRTMIKEVVNEAFTQYVEKYEAENGPLPTPKK